MKKLIFITIAFAALHAYAGEREMVKHQIQPQENLFRISLKYNSTVADIVLANPGLKPDMVRSGATIKVPKDTKIRDVAFVATFFTPKIQPAIESKQAVAVPATQAANSENILEDENPFITPVKKRKSIEQQEKESALETNVSQKAFIPKPDAMALPANEAEKPNAMADALPKANYSAMTLPTPVSIYDQQADLQADRINEAPRAEVRPFEDAVRTSPATALSPQYESEELQRRYMELMRMAANDNSVKVVDMTHIKIGGLTPESHYADLIRQLNLMIDATQVQTINLEIVMKDGTVKIISSPDEQRKVLSQLVAGEGLN